MSDSPKRHGSSSSRLPEVSGVSLRQEHDFFRADRIKEYVEVSVIWGSSERAVREPLTCTRKLQLYCVFVSPLQVEPTILLRADERRQQQGAEI